MEKNYETLYRSIKLNKIFTDVKELEKAEKEFDEAKAAKEKLEAERKADWQKVKDAYALVEAQKAEADRRYKEFIEKYKTAHKTDSVVTVKEFDKTMQDMQDFLNSYFKFVIKF